MAQQGPSEEQKAEALQFKNAGNKAFKAKEWADAVKLYTEAITRDNTNHVFFSNRSAAYLSQGLAASALSDARRVLTLKPDWPKGYSRAGAALHALKRYEEAIKMYTNGLEVAPENQVLKDGLAASKKAKNPPPKPEKKATAGAGQGSASSAGAGAGAAASANGTAETSSAAGPAEKSQADMDLEALFSFAEEVEQQQYVKKKEVSAQPEVDFGTTEQQIERLLQPHYKFINLNPFEVLMLTTEATKDEIKDRYRRLSTLVHPDKTRDSRAPDAFHEVKKAYTQLMNDDRRTLCVDLIKSATEDVERDRRKLRKRLKVTEEELPMTFDEQLKRETRKLFASIEHRRKRYEKGRKKQEMREREAEIEQEVKMRTHFKDEQLWQKGREKRVGDWRHFKKDPKKRRLIQKGPKETRLAEDLEFGKKHLTPAQLAEMESTSKVDTYKRQWR